MPSRLDSSNGTDWFHVLLLNELNSASSSGMIMSTSQLYSRLAHRHFALTKGSNDLQNLPVFVQGLQERRSPTVLMAMNRGNWSWSLFASVAGSPATVIISVKLATSDRYTRNNLRSWIQNRLFVAHRIRVDHVYPSESALFIMAITFDIWYGLQKHPGIKFLGFEFNNDNYRTRSIPLHWMVTQWASFLLPYRGAWVLDWLNTS